MKQIVFLVTMIALPGMVRAQLSPEAAADKYYHAIQQGDWSQIASMLHSEAVAGLHQVIVESLELLPDSSNLSEIEKRISYSRQEILSALNVESVSAIRQMTPEVAFGLFLTFGESQNQSMLRFLTGMESMTTYEIVGVAVESNEWVHVVRRINLPEEGTPMSEATQLKFENGIRRDVLTLRRDGIDWKVWMDSGMPISSTIRMTLTRKIG